jgi:predicted peptidase
LQSYKIFKTVKKVKRISKATFFQSSLGTQEKSHIFVISKKVFMKNLLFVLTLFLFLKTNAQHIEAVKNAGLAYQYLVHYPPGYKENPDKKYPLLIFLHGRSLSGTNLEMLKNYGVIYEILRGLKIDFIVVAPQCQNGWENSKLVQVLDYAEKTYRVDKSRVYLTGMSMGGYGAWYFAGQYPNRFAAVAPVCGGGKLSDAQNLKKLPHWVHHGVKDIPVPFSESEKMVNAIRAAGNKNVEFSVYPDWGHSELHVVFSKKELYDWLLKYTLTEQNIDKK